MLIMIAMYLLARTAGVLVIMVSIVIYMVSICICCGWGGTVRVRLCRVRFVWAKCWSTQILSIDSAVVARCLVM